MQVWGNRDYSKIDFDEINHVLFYPRRDPFPATDQFAQTVMIPVSVKGAVSSLWSEVRKPQATILFFHGNGELASEYQDIAGLFNQRDISFICADYRGYGQSTGQPAVRSMLEDAHDIFRYVSSRARGQKELLLVMGRSLGSAPALEIAASYGDQIDGLIIESGFAETLPLLKTVGADPQHWGIREEDGFAHREKIGTFTKPLLIIHAENDFLIRFEQAEKLFAAANSGQKKLLKIPHAGHNDIFFTGMKDYLTALSEFMKTSAAWKVAPDN